MPTLNFGTQRGTATVRGPGGAITAPVELGAFLVPLQAGKFCT